MRRSKKQNKSLSKQTWKRKFTAALSMFLVSAILMVFTTYAWLVLSTAPEVSGITTNIGANGALEIALLNTETRMDMSAIVSNVGATVSTVGAYQANTNWGNLIDLSDERYGMSNITLLPARLALSGDAENGYRTAGAYLSVPQYDYDGRVIHITDDTVSAIYGKSDFSFTSGKQDYGVRAIGTSGAIDSLGAALASARGNVATYTSGANNEARIVLENRGEELFGIVLTHATNSNATYTNENVASLKALVTGLQKSLSYIEEAYRQALMGYAAANAGNYEEFAAIKNSFSSDGKTLAALVAEYRAILPEIIVSSVETLDALQNDMRYAATECDALTSGTYTWAQISPIMNRIMSSDKVYIGDSKLSDADASTLLSGSGEIVVTLAPGSGVPAGIADFAGDYGVWYNLMGKNVNITTETTQSPTYLAAVSAAMKSLKANDSASGSQAETSLEVTYGYAIDLAFRTNVANADLLLQTDAAQRIYEDSASDATQGGGSYMQFSALSDDFTVGDILTLMDAVRVGFIDDKNNILGIARLNTSNRTVDGGTVEAPLYLYDYTVSEGILTMGERRKSDATITNLDRNIAKAVTAVVWLDGDLIDNTMVPAEQNLALSGFLNLQFSTNADLTPAHNEGAYSLRVDREGLSELLDESKPIYRSGKGMNTTESWNAFSDAYGYAEAVAVDLSSTAIQVENAVNSLSAAKNGLKEVTHDALNDKIKEVRAEVGTGRVNYYAYYYDGVFKSDLPEGIDENTPAGVIVEKHIDEKSADYDKYTKIFGADYIRNDTDNGKGVVIHLHTMESWDALNEALCKAIITEMDPTLTNDELDDAITALDNAFKGLKFETYFEAYELNGAVYYCSLGNDTSDKYIKWYDSNFDRVISDKRILDLEAKATPIEVATIVMQDYVDNTTEQLLPSVVFNKWYNADDEIIGLRWCCDRPELFTFDQQLEELDRLIAAAKALKLNDSIDSTHKDAINAAINEAVEVRNTVNGTEDLSSYITTLQELLDGYIFGYNYNYYGYTEYGVTVFNWIEMPYAMLHINGEDMNTTVTLNAYVLTKNGVIYKATKDVTLYTKAEDAEIKVIRYTITVGDKADAAGAHLVSVKDKITTETIRNYSWSSSDTSVATVEDPKSGVCRIAGVGAGNATITVSVTTYQGNTYTASYTITVEPASEESTENP